MYEVLKMGLLGNFAINLMHSDGNVISMIIFVILVFAPIIIIIMTLSNTENSSIIISVIALLIMTFGSNFILAELVLSIIFYFWGRNN